MCIRDRGWNQLGDPSSWSREELDKRVFAEYGPGHPGATRALWYLYHSVAPGDVILAKRGVSVLLDVGEVSGPPYFDPAAGNQRINGLSWNQKPNFLPVRWKGRDPMPLEIGQRLPRGTLIKLNPMTHRSLLRQLSLGMAA